MTRSIRHVNDKGYNRMKNLKIVDGIIINKDSCLENWEDLLFSFAIAGDKQYKLFIDTIIRKLKKNKGIE